MTSYKLERDGPPSIYKIMEKYIKTLKGVPGLSCEIGLRRGGGTLTMLKAFLDNEDPRTHICIDPYGNIIYNDICGAHRSDYTNTMKYETLAELYKCAMSTNTNIIFFNIEDSEFYQRFGDGVPIYEYTKLIVNEYCCVHVDGQHDLPSVMTAAKFFFTRVPSRGIIFFDNTDHYDHSPVHKFLLDAQFEFLEDVDHKKVYRKP